jgi:hypothetical protein
MTRRAIDAVGAFQFQVLSVRKLYVPVRAGDCMRLDLFGLLRRVATKALCLGYRGTQVRFHSGLGMTTGALDVGGEFGLYSIGFKFVAKATVRSKAASGIGARSRITVPGMRKICQDAARGQHIGFVTLSAVALSAEQRPRFLFEIILVADAAFGMPGPLQFHRSPGGRNMAEAAHQRSQSLIVKRVNEEILRAGIRNY